MTPVQSDTSPDGELSDLYAVLDVGFFCSLSGDQASPIIGVSVGLVTGGIGMVMVRSTSVDSLLWPLSRLLSGEPPLLDLIYGTEYHFESFNTIHQCSSVLESQCAGFCSGQVLTHLMIS